MRKFRKGSVTYIRVCEDGVWCDILRVRVVGRRLDGYDLEVLEAAVGRSECRPWMPALATMWLQRDPPFGFSRAEYMTPEEFRAEAVRLAIRRL